MQDDACLVPPTVYRFSQSHQHRCCGGAASMSCRYTNLSPSRASVSHVLTTPFKGFIKLHFKEPIDHQGAVKILYARLWGGGSLSFHPSLNIVSFCTVTRNLFPLVWNVKCPRLSEARQRWEPSMRGCAQPLSFKRLLIKFCLPLIKMHQQLRILRPSLLVNFPLLFSPPLVVHASVKDNAGLFLTSARCHIAALHAATTQGFLLDSLIIKNVKVCALFWRQLFIQK